MKRTKHERLRDLEEEIASVRKQPILSSKEKERLEKAERQVACAIEDAERSKVGDDDPIQLYEDESIAELCGRDLGLTLTEFELLQMLKENEPKSFTRQQLLEKVFIADDQSVSLATERTVDAHIRNLREKLGRYEDKIQTVRGVGYRYNKDADVKTI